MPDRETQGRTAKPERRNPGPKTQTGEFIREEIHHIREGKAGAGSPQLAIAIGLSEARRAGVKLSPPKGPAAVRKKAAQDAAAGRKAKGSLRKTKTSAKRSRASEAALKREARSAASHEALSRQAKKSAVKRGKQARRQAGMKAARTRKAA